MSSNGSPIIDHHKRLEWLLGELKQKLGTGSAVTGTKLIVVWYMSFGFSMGLSRIELEASLSSLPELKAIAVSLSDEDISQGKPPPVFVEGQLVEVIVNARNTTYHKGIVRGVSWHHKEGQWIFVLEENGKRVSKRYEAKDLRAEESGEVPAN